LHFQLFIKRTGFLAQRVADVGEAESFSYRPSTHGKEADRVTEEPAGDHGDEREQEERVPEILDVGKSLHEVATLFHQMDRYDVGVGQLSSGAGFSQKPLP